MALGKMMGLEGNPLYSAFDSRRNALMGVGAGLLSGNWGNMGRYAMEGRQMDDAYATAQEETAARQEQLNITVQAMLADGREDLANLFEGGVKEAAGEYLRWKSAQMGGVKPTAEIQNFEYGQKNPDFLEWQTQKGGPAEMSLQPTWLQDEQGGWHFGQATKDGRIIESQLPPGMSAVPPADIAGAKAGATVDAKTAAAARAALPGAEQMMTITNKAVEEVRNNAAGMREWFSQVGPRGVYIHPGSAMGNFFAASSPTNAQAFMQARNMLKGGGQITDYEGRRAEDAMSRMQAALDTGDQQAYLTALADFEMAVADGYSKLQQAAQGGYSAGSPAVTGSRPGGQTSGGVSWSVE